MDAVRSLYLDVILFLILDFRGDFMAAALPNADVIAFVRNVGTKADPTYVPNIFWVGQDQVCHSISL